MSEPKKLTREELDYIRGLIDEVRSYVYVPDLLAHIAALEQERDKWKALAGEWMSGFADSCLERDAARARAEAAEDRVKVLEEGLNHFVDQYCEGWCREDDGFHHDCGGCRARAALSTAKEPGKS